MRLTADAQAWLNAKVQGIMAHHHLSEPERAGVHYELMSHLHGAAEPKAQAAGRDEVTVGDLEAALLDMGGEAALVEAFVAPRAKPLQRAGLVKRTGAWVVDVILLFFATFLLAAVLWLSVDLMLAPFGGTAGRFSVWHDLFHPDAFGGPFSFPFGFGAVMGLLVLGYFTYFETRDGHTFGKRVFDLRVQKVNGSPLTYRDAALRNLVKVFPPLLVLDALFLLVFFDKEKQRVSDRLVETIVVETR